MLDKVVYRSNYGIYYSTKKDNGVCYVKRHCEMTTDDILVSDGARDGWEDINKAKDFLKSHYIEGELNLEMPRRSFSIRHCSKCNAPYVYTVGDMRYFNKMGKVHSGLCSECRKNK